MNPDPRVFTRHSRELFREYARPGAILEWRVVNGEPGKYWTYGLVRVLGRDPAKDHLIFDLWSDAGDHEERCRCPIWRLARDAWALKDESDWLCATLEGRYAR